MVIDEAFLKLNNLPIPIDVGGSAGFTPIELGGMRRAFSGKMLDQRRGTKLEGTFETTPLTPEEARMLKGVLFGEGDSWSFDKDFASSKGILPMDGKVATLRPGEGRFGGAVAVEEGTENRVPGNIQAWGDHTKEASTYSIAPVSTPYGPGVQLTGQSAERVGKRTSGDVNLGTSYATASIYFKPNVASGILRFYWDATDDTGVWHYGTFSDKAINLSAYAPGQWYRLVCTASIAPNTFAGGTGFYVWAEETFDVEIAAPQLEAKPFATSFVDGTRAGGRLSYPKSLIAGLNALTVAAWTSGPPYWVSGHKYLVAAQTTGLVPYGDHFVLRQPGSNNRISLWVRNDANSAIAEAAYDNVWDGNWHLIVGVINKSPQPGRQPIELYVDGELVASSSNADAVPDLSTIDETWGVQVGHWRSAIVWNSLIDELLILPYAATDEEIRAIYNSTNSLSTRPYVSVSGLALPPSRRPGPVLFRGQIDDEEIIPWGKDGTFYPDGRKIRFTLKEI